MKFKNTATLFAILAAVLYALNVPLSKLLLTHAEPTMMAAFLYLGAGIGMLPATVLTARNKVALQHVHPHTHVHSPNITSVIHNIKTATHAFALPF